MMLAEGDFSEILNHPIAMTFLIIAAVFLVWPMVARFLKSRKQATAA
jgi:TctA family transporter